MIGRGGFARIRFPLLQTADAVPQFGRPLVIFLRDGLRQLLPQQAQLARRCKWAAARRGTLPVW